MAFGNSYPWKLRNQTTKNDLNKELIVLIRATIITPQGSYHPTDRQVYEKFSNDPRPLAF